MTENGCTPTRKIPDPISGTPQNIKQAIVNTLSKRESECRYVQDDCEAR